ncbi:mycothiol synthase [Arthrobacter sp. zg-Y916]|uniref:mycothiol synthase n=1 Tax=Arthrobacter sp. zg-Y916 TaxID=2894190 RepID=UPI001E35150B|nr:mycothiol synthase [Arthrobacter sp. zg-Y916]MCC9192589.1 mycothiol synthase [Arthrobacter sp. zg-Y916]
MSENPLTTWPILTTRGTPDEGSLRGILELAGAAAEADGNPPLSEQTLVDLRAADADPDHLRVYSTFAHDDHSDPSTAQELAGVAVLSVDPADPDAGVLELVVHPNYRNKGVGSALARAVREDTGRDYKAWSHGNHEAAVRLAAHFGYRPVRELWRMRLTRDSLKAELPAPSLPDGVVLRSFEPGRDEDAWLKANAAAFAHHPEQGAMTRADLAARMEEPWFDPAGFLLAVREDDGELLGFHWTKVHPRMGSHPAMGEVYVVGVIPEAQGTGLGKALTLAGIRHLHDAGLDAVMLYVDADNAPAVALYRRLGFVRWDVDVMYAAE